MTRASRSGVPRRRASQSGSTCRLTSPASGSMWSLKLLPCNGEDRVRTSLEVLDRAGARFGRPFLEGAPYRAGRRGHKHICPCHGRVVGPVPLLGDTTDRSAEGVLRFVHEPKTDGEQVRVARQQLKTRRARAVRRDHRSEPLDEEPNRDLPLRHVLRSRHDARDQRVELEREPHCRGRNSRPRSPPVALSQTHLTYLHRCNHCMIASLRQCSAAPCGGGPYEPWQVVGAVLVLGVIAAMAGWLRRPWVAVVM